MAPFLHPILQQSFAIIDAEIGPHSFTAAEYAIAQRIIHSTADFEFKSLLRFEGEAIQQGIHALQQSTPIIADVSMVRQGILTLVRQTFNNPVVTAVDQVARAEPGKTRTETGLLHCLERYPDGIYVVGNAPTALLALCHAIQSKQVKPTLVIGSPVGFVGVLEAKQALANASVPQIRIEGRKGGSSVAAAIINALLLLAWNQKNPSSDPTV